jgi:hypothetical protein
MEKYLSTGMEYMWPSRICWVWFGGHQGTPNGVPPSHCPSTITNSSSSVLTKLGPNIVFLVEGVAYYIYKKAMLEGNNLPLINTLPTMIS